MECVRETAIAGREDVPMERQYLLARWSITKTSFAHCPFYYAIYIAHSFNPTLAAITESV
jgi:hypothetical protein